MLLFAGPSSGQTSATTKTNADHCGSGFTEAFVPEQMFGCNMAEACKAHDICYGACDPGGSKHGTDYCKQNEFSGERVAAKQACDTQFFWDIAKTNGNKWQCRAVAGIYTSAAAIAGQGPFNGKPMPPQAMKALVETSGTPEEAMSKFKALALEAKSEQLDLSQLQRKGKTITDAPPLAANTSASQLVVHVASAQTIPPVRDPSEVRFWNFFDRESRKHSAIQWSLEPKEFGFFTTPENQLLVPDGFKPDAGGWPAVVVTPTCGGTKASTRERIKEFLAAGYAVLTVESYKPRNTPSCRPGVVNPPTVFTDTLDALAALHTVAWINKNRIFQVGYSMGGFTAAWVASASNVGQTHGAQRFRASVGHYGSCAYQHNATAPKLPFLRRDSDRPLLMLMAENDLETPAAWCFPLLEEMKATRQNASWYIYPSMTHAWDQPESNGYSFTNGWGKQVVYRYDRATAQDATRRTLEFLEQFK